MKWLLQGCSKKTRKGSHREWETQISCTGRTWNIAFIACIKTLCWWLHTHITPAWDAAWSLATPQSLSSSPCALIRDPSSHSCTTLRDFQRLAFPFSRAFLNWQLEHDPKRRTDAIGRGEGAGDSKSRRKEMGKDGGRCMSWCMSCLAGWQKTSERNELKDPVNPRCVCVRGHMEPQLHYCVMGLVTQSTQYVYIILSFILHLNSHDKRHHFLSLSMVLVVFSHLMAIVMEIVFTREKVNKWVLSSVLVNRLRGERQI